MIEKERERERDPLGRERLGDREKELIWIGPLFAPVDVLAVYSIK